VRHILKQARAVSDNPRNEILVLVGHGARSDTNDLHQEMELARAAENVEG
jgi:cobalamin biosynthesis Co2+ chelatase CbiK